MEANKCAEQVYNENMNYESQRAAVEARRQDALARKAEFFGKWLWILFLMIIPTTITALISLDSVSGSYAAMRWIDPLLELVCAIVSAIILLKMSEREYQYRIAGVLYIIGNMIDKVVEVTELPNPWAVFILIPAGVLGLVATYNEFMGHASVMSEIDNVLAEKWRKLWKWLLIGMGSMFGSIVVMLVSVIVGLVIFLISAIAVAVMAIMKMVYLYRSAKACSRWLEDASTEMENML